MLRQCQLCGKGKEVGHNVSYSKRRTRRVFLPNLRWVKLNLDGHSPAGEGKMRICMKCLKKMKKEGKVVTRVPRESKVPRVPQEIKMPILAEEKLKTEAPKKRGSKKKTK